MKLRVLHVLNDLRGGATMSALALMSEARRRDSSIEHFAVFPGRPDRRASVLEGVAADSMGLPIRTWQQQKWQSAIGFFRWVKTQAVSGFGRRGLRRLEDLAKRWKIDVIHSNTAIVCDGARAARRLNIPHVWHIRERIGRGGFMEFPMTDGELLRFITGASFTVAVISRYVREIFSRHGLEAATEIVFDGVDTETLQDPDASARGRLMRERWNVPPETLLVGMVGGLKTTVKRHDLFLDMAEIVARRHPRVRFVILGAVPPRAEQGGKTWAGQILKRTRSEALAGKVLLPGFEADMPAVWSAMDIYVHPCAVEGFSRAILEAMAAGTPVVASAGGGNPEAIVHGQSGSLVGEQDAARYAEAVEELIAREDLRNSFARQAAGIVESRFSSPAHYEVMQRVFESAAAEGGPR